MSSSRIRELLALDSLPVNLALIDRDGKIVGVNRSWRRFGDDNGLRLDDAGVGCNYFDFCRGQTTSGLKRDLEALLGDALDVVTFLYDCRSPTEMRWCLMLGLPISHRRSDGAALFHFDTSALAPMFLSAPDLRTAHAHLPGLQTDFALELIGNVVKRSVEAVIGPSLLDHKSDRDDQLRSLLSARLSKRQIEIMKLLSDGLKNSEIAAQLQISENTVKLHVSDILKRLRLKTRTQAALLAARLRAEIEAAGKNS